MSNELSTELRREIFAQESSDPLLTLLTIEGEDQTYRLVNNSKNVNSRGNEFQAFPMTVAYPNDDGESAREFQITLDNASLELVEALRSVTQPLPCKVEQILASVPDVVQASVEELLISSVTYNGKSIVARVALDNFLGVGMTCEFYKPANYPGLY